METESGFPYLCRLFTGATRRGSPAYTGPCLQAGDQGATDLECPLIPTTVEGARGLLCSRKASQLVTTVQGVLIGLLSPQSPRLNAAYPLGPSRASGNVLPYLAEQLFDAVTRVIDVYFPPASNACDSELEQEPFNRPSGFP